MLPLFLSLLMGEGRGRGYSLGKSRVGLVSRFSPDIYGKFSLDVLSDHILVHNFSSAFTA